MPGDFSGEVKDGICDSVMGDRERAVGTYREFIFYDEASVYPEFLVRYRRVYNNAPEAECEVADDASGHRAETPASGSAGCAMMSSASGGRDGQRLRGDSQRRAGRPPASENVSGARSRQRSRESSSRRVTFEDRLHRMIAAQEMG